MKAKLKRVRRQGFPRNPVDLADLDTVLEEPRWSERFGETLQGQPFFLTTLATGDSQTAVFSDVEFARKVLSNRARVELHMDGTFKVVPNGMAYQLVTIHCMDLGHVSAVLVFLKYLY